MNIPRIPKFTFQENEGTKRKIKLSAKIKPPIILLSAFIFKPSYFYDTPIKTLTTKLTGAAVADCLSPAAETPARKLSRHAWQLPVERFVGLVPFYFIPQTYRELF